MTDSDKIVQSKTLNRLMHDSMLWIRSLAKNGPDLRPAAHIKTLREAGEFATEPSLEEAADILICIAAVMEREGWYPWELAQAMEDKLEINRNRTWIVQPDGTWQHDPSQ